MDRTSASNGAESADNRDEGKYSRRLSRREGVRVSAGRVVEVAIAMVRKVGCWRLRWVRKVATNVTRPISTETGIKDYVIPFPLMVIS